MIRKISHPPQLQVLSNYYILSVATANEMSDQGYKPTAAKTADEYAKLDAEDESLARWKASLGIVPGASNADTSGPKVRPSKASPAL